MAHPRTKENALSIAFTEGEMAEFKDAARAAEKPIRVFVREKALEALRLLRHSEPARSG